MAGDPARADRGALRDGGRRAAGAHEQQLPDLLPVAPHLEYQIPIYDLQAFLIEAELLLDWYLPRLEAPVTDRARQEFRALWTEALAPALETPPTWVLRDFHSPNLLWLPRASGIARLGILDFQDAVMGPPPTISPPCCRMPASMSLRIIELALLGRYLRRRRAADTGFDGDAIHQALRHAGGAARQQDPRHFRAARPPRRQAAISASHAAHMGLFAAFAGTSGAGPAQRLVPPAYSGTAGDLTARPRKHDGRHAIGRHSGSVTVRAASRIAPWCWRRALAPACARSTARFPSPWCRSAARR